MEAKYIISIALFLIVALGWLFWWLGKRNKGRNSSKKLNIVQNITSEDLLFPKRKSLDMVGMTGKTHSNSNFDAALVSIMVTKFMEKGYDMSELFERITKVHQAPAAQPEPLQDEAEPVTISQTEDEGQWAGEDYLLLTKDGGEDYKGKDEAGYDYINLEDINNDN